MQTAAMILVATLAGSQGGDQPASKPLFNGKDLAGWHIDCPELDKNPNGPKPYEVRNGVLFTPGAPPAHLISDDAFESYRLSVEYRYTERAGNNGILIHCSTPRFFANLLPKCLEVQLMSGGAGDFYTLGEEIEVPDIEKRRVPLTGRRIANLTDNSEKPIGQWNTIIVECRADSVIVWVNGDLVNFGYKCSTRKGQIALQCEGAPVEFRKVDLQPLG